VVKTSDEEAEEVEEAVIDGYGIYQIYIFFT